MDRAERTVRRNARVALPTEHKTVTRKPGPVAREPRPVASEPRPVAREPRPAAREPRPVAREPKPVIKDPRPATRDPRPVAREPRPTASEYRVFASIPRGPPPPTPPRQGRALTSYLARILLFAIIAILARAVHINSNIDATVYNTLAPPHTDAIKTAAQRAGREPQPGGVEAFSKKRWLDRGVALGFSDIEDLLLDLIQVSGGNDTEVVSLMEEHILDGKRLLKKLTEPKLDVLAVMEMESEMVYELLQNKAMSPSKKLASPDLHAFSQRARAHILEIGKLRKNAAAIEPLILEYIRRNQKIGSHYPPQAKIIWEQIKKEFFWTMMGRNTSKIQMLTKRFEFLEAAPYALNKLHVFLENILSTLQRFNATLEVLENALKAENTIHSTPGIKSRLGFAPPPETLEELVEWLLSKHQNITALSQVAMNNGRAILTLKE
ncbi:MAG: Proteoglycan-4 [Trizodia sp. TS-e1964]|nr:MAG: Proteoglycan-4 [Trizodia sp. TS-e1964]